MLRWMRMLVLVAVLIGCAEDPVTEVRKVRLAQWGQEKYLIYLPVYLADESGIFYRNGIEMEILFSGNDDQVFATVARGDAEFGIGDPIFAAIARSRGFPGLVIANVVGRVALWGVSDSISETLTSPSDFDGLLIGTFPRPSTTYTLLTNMVVKSNVNATIVEVPIGSEAAALSSGRVDIAMMLEPGASQAEANGYHVVTSFPELWGVYAFTGATTVQTVVDESPELVAAFRRSIQEALNLAHSNPDSATSIAQGLFPNLPEDVVASAVRRMIGSGTLPDSVDISKAGWEAAVAVRQEMGDLPRGSQFLETVPFIVQD